MDFLQIEKVGYFLSSRIGCAQLERPLARNESTMRGGGIGAHGSLLADKDSGEEDTGLVNKFIRVGGNEIEQTLDEPGPTDTLFWILSLRGGCFGT